MRKELKISPIIYFRKLSKQSLMLMRQNVNNENDVSMNPPISQYICSEGTFSHLYVAES